MKSEQARHKSPIPPRLSTPNQVGSAFRMLRWRLMANGFRLLI